LPLGLRLRVRHLALRRDLRLGDLSRQRLDGLDDRRPESLDARVVRCGTGTAGRGVAAGTQGAGLVVLAQP